MARHVLILIYSHLPSHMNVIAAHIYNPIVMQYVGWDICAECGAYFCPYDDASGVQNQIFRTLKGKMRTSLV